MERLKRCVGDGQECWPVREVAVEACDGVARSEPTELVKPAHQSQHGGRQFRKPWQCGQRIHFGTMPGWLRYDACGSHRHRKVLAKRLYGDEEREQVDSVRVIVA